MTRDELLRAWERWSAAVSPMERTLTAAAFDRLRCGSAVPLDALAAAAGVEPAEARSILAAMAEAGRATLDGEAVTGVAGLSVAAAPHRLLLEGVPLHTWCALDAIGIPAALRADAVVESRLADDGAPLRITLARGELQAAPAKVWIRGVGPEAGWRLCDGT